MRQGIQRARHVSLAMLYAGKGYPASHCLCLSLACPSALSFAFELLRSYPLSLSPVPFPYISLSLFLLLAPLPLDLSLGRRCLWSPGSSPRARSFNTPGESEVGGGRMRSRRTKRRFARGGRGQRERSGSSLVQTRRTHGTRFHRWLVGYGRFVRTIETSPAEGEPRAKRTRDLSAR